MGISCPRYSSVTGLKVTDELRRIASGMPVLAERINGIARGHH
jgi:hypothetical protein